MKLRRETGADSDAIRALTQRAFRDMPYASGNEHDIVDRLRAANALSVSLVATVDDVIVGHIAFSPATSSDGTRPWFALGPVSVDPDLQRQGIGSALVRRGLAAIETAGALGCVLVGDPQYYRRFGFELSPEHSPSDDFASHFMLLKFTPAEPGGPVEFHQAFFETDEQGDR